MISNFKYLIFFSLLVACSSTKKYQSGHTANNDMHRPQIHFSPKAHWMNDPNGMVYYNNTYHLFYQYYPDSTVWGPMHWGHATSKDLIHWQHQPIALYPDSLGYIFSGSAVADINNTSGLGVNGKVPLVAIFTHHNPAGEKAHQNNHQNQSLAYSLDEGKTWTKYAENPVLKNPGITDFRDPNVRWHDEVKKWIMTLATKDKITFYSSPDLKNWSKESEFGEKLGAHGGVWECPDLMPFTVDGKKVWVLFVSINPGGLNGGSATQYFVGDFNGKSFSPYTTETKWVDYGTDNYAGVTWSNTGDRKIFLGWMSNWQYAPVVPTVAWRSAMTIPRDLKLVNVNNNYLLTSLPVEELDVVKDKEITLNNVSVNGNYDLSDKLKNLPGQYKLNITSDTLKSFSIQLSNDQGEQVQIGYNKQENVYYVDRTRSGKTDFEKGFAKRFTGPRLTSDNKLNLTLIIDVASAELFADNGLTVMTAIFFPHKTYDKAVITSDDNTFSIKQLHYTGLKSIW